MPMATSARSRDEWYVRIRSPPLQPVGAVHEPPRRIVSRGLEADLGEEIRCGSGVAASTENGCELGGTSLLEVLRIGRYARYSSAGPWSASIDMSHPYLR